MAHYLVTGTAGFIASKVVELLLAEGHTVAGLDNLNDAYDVRLKQWRLERLTGQRGFSFHRVDISDRALLEKWWSSASRFDAVLNLAAHAGVRYSVEDPWVYISTNITGTVNLLELCWRNDVEKFVLASTSSLYGTRNSVPYREDANTDRPLSPYAASKKAAEDFCCSCHLQHGLDVTVLRYFTVYGPAGRPDMSLFRFIQWIAEERPVRVYGDGTQSRDFTYVDDIARGTLAAIKPLGYKIINLGSDRPVSIMDSIRLIERLLGRTAQIEYHPTHPADVKTTWADIDVARRHLNWEPKVVLQEGAERCVRWYLDNQEWARDIVNGVASSRAHARPITPSLPSPRTVRAISSPRNGYVFFEGR